MRASVQVDSRRSMRSSFLPFARPSLGEEEITEVVDTLRSGWITTGPKTERFAAEFLDYVGGRFAIPVSSATAGRILSPPPFPGLSDADQDDAIAGVREVLAEFQR